MVVRRILSYLSLAVLMCSVSACQPSPSFQQTLDQQNGKPVKSLFAAWGYPTSEGKVAGKKYYAWSKSVFIPSLSVPITTGTGSVSGKSFNYTQTNFGSNSAGEDSSCLIRAFVNAADKIETSDWNGACLQYIKKIEAPAK